MSRLLLLLVLLGPAGGQAVLEGRLVFIDAAPAGIGADATRVELTSLATGTEYQTVPADDGSFRFTGLPPGDYQLAAIHPRGLGARTFIEVPEPAIHTCELRLASRAAANGLTLVWVALALLLTAAFAAGILLYGLGRRRGAKARRSRREQLVPLGSVTIALLLWCAAFLLFRLVGPTLQPSRDEVLNPLSAICCALLAGCVVLVLVDVRPKPLAAVSAILAGWSLAAASASADWSATAARLGIGLGILLWATAAGCLMAHFLRRPGYLVMCCLVAGIVDFWAVFFGPTGRVVASTAPADQSRVQLMVLPWPLLGGDLAPPMIGAGDLLFCALLLVAAIRFELGRIRNFWALMAAFTTGSIMAHVLARVDESLPGLPALPFLGAFFLAANRGRLLVPVEDRRRIALFCGGLALFLATYSALRPQAEEPSAAEPAPTAAAEGPWTRNALRAGEPRATSRVVSRDDIATVEAVSFGHAGLAPEPMAAGWLVYPPGQPRGVVIVLPAEGTEPDLALARGWAAEGVASMLVDWDPTPAPASSAPALPRPADQAGWPGAGLSPWATEPRASRLYWIGTVLLNAVDYLATRAELADPPVVFGDSSAGIAALTTAAHEPRIRAVIAANVGSLQGDPGRFGRELAQLDPAAAGDQRRIWSPDAAARRMTQPVLLAAGTNNADITLDGVRRLAGRLTAGGSRLALTPNAEIAAIDVALTARWIRGEDAAAPPELTATVRGDLVTVVADDRRAPCLAGGGPNGAPGYAWLEVPASVALRVSREVDGLVLFAVAADGLVTSRPLRLSAGQFGPRVAVTPSGLVSLTGWRPTGADQRAGIRAVATRDGVALTRPTSPVDRVTLVTNQLLEARALGPSASALTIDGVAAGVIEQVRVVQRYAQLGEVAVAVPLEPHGDGLTGRLAGLAIDWRRVDAVTMTVRTGPGPRFERVAIRGGPRSEIEWDKP